MIKRRLFTASLAACAWQTAKAQVPGMAGLGADTAISETWADAARSRAVPVKIRWPDPQAHPGQRPLVLFSHGLGGTVDGGAVWGQAWAAAGLVVIHVQHAGSDLAAVRRAASSLADKAALRSLANGAQVLARLQDVGFVLDEVARRQAANAGRWASVRPNHVGMSGHSMGATTTLGMAGQRFAGVGPSGSGMTEPRLAAFIALSPGLPAGGDASHAFEPLTRPLLCITGTRDGDVIGNGRTPERRLAVYGALPPGNKAQLVLQDADHMTFGGQTGRAVEIGPREAVSRDLQSAHHALVASVTTDWWRATLQNDLAASNRLATPAGLRAGDLWQQK